MTKLKANTNWSISQLTGERYGEHVGLLNSEAVQNTNLSGITNLSLCLCRNCQLQGIKLLHSAAISKQIVTASAAEVGVNDNSVRETGGFLSALNRSRRRGRKYHLQVLLKMTLFALFKLTHLWYPVRLHSSQYQWRLSYDNFGVFWYYSGVFFPPRESMLHIIPYGWIEETFLPLLVTKRKVKEMYTCLTQSQLNGLSHLRIQ